MINKLINFLEIFRINPLIEANKNLIDRYTNLINSNREIAYIRAINQGPNIREEDKELYRIISMVSVVQEKNSSWPTDKTSRWIGYIQRYLIEKEMTTVQAEREFSRVLFHKAYKELGYKIPETLNIK